MSNKSSSQGQWESQSASSTAVKIGNNPAHIAGREASAEGTFDVSEFLNSIFCLNRFV
jgi:hypothetical protein